MLVSWCHQLPSYVSSFYRRPSRTSLASWLETAFAAYFFSCLFDRKWKQNRKLYTATQFFFYQKNMHTYPSKKTAWKINAFNLWQQGCLSLCFACYSELPDKNVCRLEYRQINVNPTKTACSWHLISPDTSPPHPRSKFTFAAEALTFPHKREKLKHIWLVLILV